MMVKNAKRRTTALYHRLMKLKPEDLTNNQWTQAAGLSTSFFTGLKNGHTPAVWHLEAALDVLGMTLADFFAEEPPPAVGGRELVLQAMVENHFGSGSGCIAVAPKDAWRMLGISKSKGYQLLARDELEAFKIDGSTRITIASIHAFVARQILAEKA